MAQVEQPYLVILAGGRGERFWPLSRKNYPKQLLRLLSDQSLLQHSVSRIAGLTAPEKILVVVNLDYEMEVRRQLPGLLSENIITEPESRNTAPAIGYATTVIRKRSPGKDPVIAFMPSDLMVSYPDVWRNFILAGTRYCTETGKVVIPGSKPSRPETGFGYIHLGEEIKMIDGFSAFHVSSFVEKPDQKTAEKYFKDSNYLWNGGISIWRISSLIEAINLNIPELRAGLEKLEKTTGEAEHYIILNEVYPNFPAVSIDHGFLENMPDMVVFAADFGWDDLGSWSALHRLITQDECGNIYFGEHTALDTHNCVIYSPKKFTATLGLENLIIVETEDALMVCARERVQDVREIIKRLKEQNQFELL